MEQGVRNRCIAWVKRSSPEMSHTGSGIVLLGGGVVGLTTALLLRQRGVEVTVVERSLIGREASWAGAGMLPPGRAMAAESAEVRLRSFSCLCWSELNDLLQRLTGADNGYRICGSCVLADAAEEAEREAARWSSEGVLAEVLDGGSLRQRFPMLSAACSAAVWLPEFAQVRNPWHLQILRSACESAGVSIVENAGDASLECGSGRITAVRTADRVLYPTAVCLTSGAWTGGLLEQFGVQSRIRPIRGQMVLMRVGAGWLPGVVECGRRYLVPRHDGLLLAGSTEEDVGFCRENTVAGVRGLLEFACELVPELAVAPIVKTWAGLRPGTPDGLPLLGRVAGCENLYVGAGHFRSGLQMSPGTARILCDLMLDGRSPISLEGLQVERFSAGVWKGASCER